MDLLRDPGVYRQSLGLNIDELRRQIKSVRGVCLRHCDLDPELPGIFNEATELEGIRLEGCKHSVALALGAVCGQNQLSVIDLRGTREITDRDLLALSWQRKLRELYLGGCLQLTSQLVEFISSLPELCAMSLGYTRVTGNGLLHLAERRRQAGITKPLVVYSGGYLEVDPEMQPEIERAGIEFRHVFKNCFRHRIGPYDLRMSGATNADVYDVVEKQRLDRLHLGGCNVDDTLEPGSMNGVRHLWLDYTEAGSTFVREIIAGGGLSESLVSLSLVDTPVTSDAVEELLNGINGVPLLRTIDVGGSLVTDEEQAALRALASTKGCRLEFVPFPF